MFHKVMFQSTGLIKSFRNISLAYPPTWIIIASSLTISHKNNTTVMITALEALSLKQHVLNHIPICSIYILSTFIYKGLFKAFFWLRQCYLSFTFSYFLKVKINLCSHLETIDMCAMDISRICATIINCVHHAQ